VRVHALLYLAVLGHDEELAVGGAHGEDVRRADLLAALVALGEPVHVGGVELVRELGDLEALVVDEVGAADYVVVGD